ncbi:unnamed protein product [Caenorhabditis angaria]|uniref:Uncharacterized protein n=1 Tax=Caenorhabditis angaria TaxID=860376 RepID=A0A9P1IDR6_9PELO|nr:unnamed protein product [Caenorhabditis angaria]
MHFLILLSNIFQLISCINDYELFDSYESTEQSYNDEIEGTLLMTQVVWRHGDRSPIDNYLSDARYEQIWQNGWGELTEIGIQQQFELGKKLRDRYVGNLLSKKFDFREVYIQSTDRNRTIMSAMANMAGMFQKETDSRGGEDEEKGWPKGWIPIPIHIIRDDDPENVFSSCPRADQLEKDITRSAYHRKVVRENFDFFSLLSEKTGKRIDISNIFDIYDKYFIERLYNLSQPEWLTKNIVKKMKNIAAIDTQFDNGIGKPYVPELIRLRGGRLLKSMIQRMTQKINSLSADGNKWISNLKYHALSAHDTTLYALLATFGNPETIINSSFPQYCATLTLELWLLGDEKIPHVKILFDDGISDNSKIITNLVEGCPEHSYFCSLETFSARSIQFIPEDIHEECLEKFEPETDNQDVF